jgi:hypothetical protein
MIRVTDGELSILDVNCIRWLNGKFFIQNFRMLKAANRREDGGYVLPKVWIQFTGLPPHLHDYLII